MQQIQAFAGRHPQIVAWVALAIGMVIILVWSAKDVGLLPSQMAALVVATIILAGLCVWIIGWEDNDAEPSENAEGPKPRA